MMHGSNLVNCSVCYIGFKIQVLVPPQKYKPTSLYQGEPIMGRIFVSHIWGLIIREILYSEVYVISWK